MSRVSTSAIPSGSLSSPVVVKEAVTLRAILDDCERLVNIEALRSGDACSPSDPGLGSSIAGLTTSIERQVGILQPILIELRELLRRAEHQSQLNDAFLSPVRRLPNEILAEIFLLTVARDRPLFPRIRPDFAFSRVCQRWRAVALGTTALWTNISVWPTEPAEIHDRFVRELELAGDRPLDVRFAHQWPCDDNADKPTKSWELLQSLSHRWRTLRLELDSSYFRVLTPRPIVCSSLVALYLKQEVLEPDRTPGLDDKGHLLTALSYAPMLRTVDIQAQRVRGGSSPLSFPDSWRLTDLSIFANQCDGSVSRFVPLFEQNANTLKKLNLSLAHFAGSFYMTPVVLPVVSMPQLTELTCRMRAAELVSSIDAPQLSRLTIDSDLWRADDHALYGLPTLSSLSVEGLSGHADDLSGDGLPSVGRRIGMYKHLTSLTVSNVTWATSSLLPTLHILPRLTYLKLEEDTPGALITQSLLEALTRGGTDVDGKITSRNLLCPLPNLARMHLALQAAGFEDRELAPAVRKMGLSRAATKPQSLVAFCSQYKLYLFPKATSDILVFGIEK
ncbi:hypothetical protein K523DRAFT_309382 [Schizophyllum commune Tattone D]|nr:hypothetical protein K523DRAFT_309382 [Schizophyllum commune Tattone D]